MILKAGNLVACMVLVGAVLSPLATGGDWDRKTVVTFRSSVEIPGVHLVGWAVLPPGTYVFTILDSQSDRHIVQIASNDEKTVYATILAVPNYRLRATDKTVITFRERTAERPDALRAWFYPGKNWGEEFVYPKSKAVELAKASDVPVLFTPANLPVEVDEPIRSADLPIVMEMQRVPIMAVKPTGEEAQLAEVVTPPVRDGAVAAAPALIPERAQLPSTASRLQLVTLLGLFAVVAAFTIRPIARVAGLSLAARRNR